jgi:hypothetical protein
MKFLRKINLKCPRFLMAAAIRLMKRNGAQCAVLAGRSKSDAANDEVFEMRRMK